MITLYGFGPNFGLPDASGFVLKLDCYLRAAGIEYERVNDFEYLNKSPKGKLPYITDNGKVIADTSFIIDYLKDTYGDNLDNELTDEQRAISRAFIKMLDENLYWCIVWSRWIDEKGWPRSKEEFFGNMPVGVKQVIPAIARRGIRKSLHGHGMGRHTRDEILIIANKDLEALSHFLGNKPYFLVNQATTLDVTVYGHLAQLILADFDSDFNDQARSYANLVEFVNRMKALYYPDD